MKQYPFILLFKSNNFIIGDQTGEIHSFKFAKEVYSYVKDVPIVVCNKVLILDKLEKRRFSKVFDILELFAFVKPAEPIIPAIQHIAEFLNLSCDFENNITEEVKTYYNVIKKLLDDISTISGTERYHVISLLITMVRNSRWEWGIDILQRLGVDINKIGLVAPKGYAVWERLPEWEETVPTSISGTQQIDENDVLESLKEFISKTKNAENRTEQIEYAKSVSKIFNPREEKGFPNTVLAQAGTGIGKTLGYLSPVNVWGNINSGSIFISTYTKNLQKQLDEELNKVYDNPQVKQRNVVVRKGRENYICLLNYAEAVGKISNSKGDAVFLGLIARWLSKTKTGDMNGGDFPGWLVDLIENGKIENLFYKRGECLYSQCPHFKKCFIEKVLQKSKLAKIIIENHALIMHQFADAKEDVPLSTRYIFDEGHQIFEAADDVFSIELSTLQGFELRRILLGSEDAKISRMKGLKKRFEDLILVNEKISEVIFNIYEKSSFLPQVNALKRIKNRTPSGAFEDFLTEIYRQVLARSESNDTYYSLECFPRPLDEKVHEKGQILYYEIVELEKKVDYLLKLIEKFVDDHFAELDSKDKQRYISVSKSIKQNVLNVLGNWRIMLGQLETETPKDFVDWFEITRSEGFEVDVGYHRHYVDPTIPFSSLLSQVAHGVLITSATLKDKTKDDNLNWDFALKRTGIIHYCDTEKPQNLLTVDYKSPFDYKTNSRVFIVNDIDKNDIVQVSAAYRELFLASQGGGLGIFTAISRLKEIYKRIKSPLGDNDISLFSQHIDRINIQTLIDIFKADKKSCLLGTDAVRDGIDVPGESLKMIVFDKVPWNRSNILNKARKELYGNTYDYISIRMKLSQAYGRLIRKATDRGIFVILDRAVPSEVLTAFPSDVNVEKISFKETIEKVRDFFSV